MNTPNPMASRQDMGEVSLIDNGVVKPHTLKRSNPGKQRNQQNPQARRYPAHIYIPKNTPSRIYLHPSHEPSTRLCNLHARLADQRSTPIITQTSPQTPRSAAVLLNTTISKQKAVNQAVETQHTKAYRPFVANGRSMPSTLAAFLF
jgi:hypothetical protein